MVQKPLLAIRAASKASERSVRAKDTMARNDDAERVLANGRPDSADSERVVHFLGNVPVPQCLSVFDFLEVLPDFDLKIGAFEIQRNGETFAPIVEILLKFSGGQVDNGIVIQLHSDISRGVLVGLEIDSA